MDEFEIFDFTPEIIEQFRAKREIPVHFYNKDGQILIYKKEDASDKEIERILRFVHQGIYYNLNDKEKLNVGGNKREIPDGLSDVKLLGEQHAQQLSNETAELFSQLKRTSITSIQAKKTSSKLAGVFNDFADQPDAMIGLVNIIELMKGVESTHEVETAVKRTVVAMALKTRGMQAQSSREKSIMKEMVNNLMMSSLLCDMATIKMNMPRGATLNDEEMKYIRNHPIMSYLMLAHEPEISDAVKFNILNHHRPLRDGSLNNNYPQLKSLRKKLEMLQEKYRDDPAKQNVIEDIARQRKLLSRDSPYNEDANIIALASEFASLTSKVPWRDAYTPTRAVKMIVNNSFFTYTERIVREFLDYVAISLCDNRKIIEKGDFIIVAAKSLEGNAVFEICRVTDVGRHQSRPGIDRIATIFPDIAKSPKLKFSGFNLDKLKPDPRHAHYELNQDDSRHIIYIVDPEYEEDLFKRLLELTKGKKA